MTTDAPARPSTATARPVPLTRGGPAVRILASWLMAAALVAAGGSLALPDVLQGTPVIDGNLRGTALVVLVVALPLTAFGLRRTRDGDPRGLVALTGGVAYLTYQGVMFCFATPFNALFLAYVALLGLGVWTLVAILVQVDREALAATIDERTPYRAVSLALGAFAALNALGWLARIVPAAITGDPAAGIEGSGLPTSPVWVQDLAIWVPAAFFAAALMWRRRPLGVLLTSSMLTFYVVECLSVASDQWWGVRADSSEPALASMAAVPGALLVAALTAVPLVWSLRHLRATTASRG